MARRREFSVFSLSFLDIMACGFGAIILVFIVIHHSTEVKSSEQSRNLMAEVNRLEVEVKDETEHLVQLRNTAALDDDEIATAEARTLAAVTAMRELQSRIAALSDSGASKSEAIEKLKQDLKKLEQESATLEGSVGGDEQKGASLRTFIGQGDRQYLTGINMGGEHILILLDSSASMLHQTIVNAVRMSNMDDADKLKSEKWQRAVRTVEWIMANLPKDASFQLLTFNTEVRPLTSKSATTWLSAADKQVTDQVLQNLKLVIPAAGTSLHQAFAAVRKLEPQPDNIFLIVDGLPTQDMTVSSRSVIKSADRVKLFSSALDSLPQSIPVNVILFPMEGDPLATPYFWILAQVTAGSFLTPSEDWP